MVIYTDQILSISSALLLILILSTLLRDSPLNCLNQIGCQFVHSLIDRLSRYYRAVLLYDGFKKMATILLANKNIAAIFPGDNRGSHG